MSKTESNTPVKAKASGASGSRSRTSPAGKGAETKARAARKAGAIPKTGVSKTTTRPKKSATSEGFPGAKKILMTGGTGFIGSRLREELIQQGHYLTVVTRQKRLLKGEQAKNLRFISWSEQDLRRHMAGQDAVIHLAGEGVAGKRWTDQVKKAIHDSRVLTTRGLVDAMASLPSKERPSLFISASAVGIYGSQGDVVLSEGTAKGTDFLAMVCVQWEAEALKAESLGVRTAIPRIGIVLGEGGGMLEKMELPFRLFVGGSLGSGRQFVPWIHIDDVCRGLVYPILQQNLRGPYNLCAPEPVTMKEFATTMGHVLHRPSLFTVPTFALRLVFGESAGAILGSLRVKPAALEAFGFEFHHPVLEEALNEIL